MAHRIFIQCVTWALSLQHMVSSWGVGAYLLHGMWDLSSLTKYWTGFPCTASQILNLWITREVPAIITFEIKFIILVVHGLCLVAVHGLRMWWLLLLLSMGSGARGLSICSPRTLELRLSSCDTGALLPWGIWDLPGPGIEPMSPALAGGFLTPGLPEKSCHYFYSYSYHYYYMWHRFQQAALWMSRNVDRASPRPPLL